MEDNVLRTPLIPHKYPLWVYGYLFILFVSILFSFYTAPKYIKAFESYQLGKQNFQSQKYDEAIIYFKRALTYTPSSDNIKIELAEVLFRRHLPGDNRMALGYLNKIQLDKYDYQDIKQVMPTEYQQYLQSSRKE